MKVEAIHFSPVAFCEQVNTFNSFYVSLLKWVV